MEIADSVGACINDPLAFVSLVFDWGVGELESQDGPDVWQTGVLTDIRDNVTTVDQALRIAVSSGHGVGKSALVAWIILWFMSTRVNCAGVVTANTKDQLTTKTWRELSIWHKRALNAHWFRWTATKFYHVDNVETWFISAIPWSKERSEAFAGLHARDVLVIFDEASAIDDVIWEVAEGAMTTEGALFCVFGNPTRNTGTFHGCFTRFKHRWITKQVDSRNAKMANRKQIDQWVEDYGEDSDFVRVRVRGVFPRAGTDQFIPSDYVYDAQKRVGQGHGPKIFGVDVARFGDDQTVILLRNGDKLEWMLRHRGLDLMQTASRVADLIMRYKPDDVFVDGVGVGGGVVDRLRQMGYRCTDVNAGGKASDDMRFFNLRAEMWSKMRDWLKDRGNIPEDQELEMDLTGVEYGFDNRNRLQLEKKQDMKARGLASPDHGDGLALTFARPVALPEMRTKRFETAAPVEDPFT